MFRHLNLFNLFQQPENIRLLTPESSNRKNYGTSQTRRNIDLHPKQNAEKYFYEQDQQLAKKMAIIDEIKKHINKNPASKLLDSVGYYQQNMELADRLISEADLSNDDKAAFKKEIFFDPAKLVNNKSLVVNHNFYDTYNKLIVTLSHPNHFDEFHQNRKTLEMLIITYKKHVDSLYGKYSFALKENQEALDLLNQASSKLVF